MSKLQHFKMMADHAEYRPVAHVSLQKAVQLIADAIAFAREQRVKKLLVVTNGLTGFESPNTTNRFYFMHEWAKASNHAVCVAFVALPEMIDPDRFGVTVATNIGFIADVFASEVEALVWLQGVEIS